MIRSIALSVGLAGVSASILSLFHIIDSAELILLIISTALTCLAYEKVQAKRKKGL